MEGMSERVYSAHARISRVAIQKARKASRLVVYSDGSINAAASDVRRADMTDPDWEPVMKRASAIVTNRGGRTCHAAIIARELGIPELFRARAGGATG